MVATIITSVDLAKNVRDFINHTNVFYANNHLRDTIFDADDDDFLRVSKKIGSSVTILSVIKIDDNFIRKAILGK